MRRTLILGALAGSIASISQAQTVINWATPTSGAWGAPNSWSPQIVPNSVAHAPTLGFTTPYTVLVSGGYTIGALNIPNPDATLQIFNNCFLNIGVNGVPTPFILNGTVVINPTSGGNGTYLAFFGDSNITGTGTIVLNGNPSNTDTAYLYSYNGAQVTLGPGITVRGSGHIYSPLINNGLMSSDLPGQTMLFNSTTLQNNATVRASAGSFVDVVSVGVVQSPSATLSAAGGTLRFNSATVSGGGLTNSGGSVQFSGSSVLEGVTITGDAEIENNCSVYITGTKGLSHSGTLTVNPAALGNGTALHFSSSGDLGGTGALFLNANPANLDTAYLNSNNTSFVTNTASHTIRGSGRIYSPLINNGLISSDLPGRSMMLNTNAKVNNSTIQAINGAVLEINSISLDQSAAGLIHVGNGSTVYLESCYLNGGTLDAAGSGRAVVYSSSTIAKLALAAPLDIPNNVALTTRGPVISQSGVITVNPSAGGNGTYLNIADSATFTGGGSVLLNANPANLDTAYITTAGGAVVTLGSGFTVHGTGHLYGSMVNSGLISADVSGRTLEMVNTTKSNEATIQAVNGGNLSVYNMNLFQENAGKLLAANASTIGLNSCNVNGLLDAAGTGSYTMSGSVNLESVTLNGPLSVPNNCNLQVSGSQLVNNASITVNPTSGGNGTYINFEDAMTVSGSGEIVLAANPSNLSTAYIDSGAAWVTFAPGKVVRGAGGIYAGVINFGTITADVAGSGIQLSSQPKINQGTLRAKSGAYVYLAGIDFEQAGAGQVVAEDGGAVYVNNSLVNGTFASVNSGFIEFQNGTILSDVTLNGQGHIPNNSAVLCYGAGFSHSGDFVINPSQGGNGTFLRFDQGAVLGGSGNTILNCTPSNISTAYIQANNAAILTIANGHTVSGSGGLYGNFVVHGRLDPAGSRRELNIPNNNFLTFKSDATLHVDIADATHYDQLTAGSVLRLAGTLEVGFDSGGGGIPFGVEVPVVTASPVQGRFDAVTSVSPYATVGVRYTGNQVFVTLHCNADYNGDGFIDIYDFTDFQTDFENGDPKADFNGDGFTDIYDFNDFVNAFEGGC